MIRNTGRVSGSWSLVPVLAFGISVCARGSRLAVMIWTAVPDGTEPLDGCALLQGPRDRPAVQ